MPEAVIELDIIFCTDCGADLTKQKAFVCGEVAVLCEQCLLALHKRVEHREQAERLGLGYECHCIECEFS